MSSRALGAAALTFVAVALIIVEVVSWPQSASFAPTVTNVSRCELGIVSVGDADRASGLREGDRLLLPAMAEPARIAVSYKVVQMQVARANETVNLAVQRGDRQFTLPYLFRHTDSLGTFAAQLGFKLVLLGIGLFVLWRGRDRASLVLGIWCLGVGVALPDTWWGALPTNGRLAGAVLGATLWTYSPFVLYLVVESIATGVSERARLIARTLMALTVAPALIVNTVNATAQASSGCAPVYLASWAVNATFAGSQLVTIGFFILSYIHSVGIERQRVRWVFWAYLLSRAGVLLNLFNRLAVHPIHLSGVEWLTVMIFPIGCAYAILRHRVIDVSFVLNRTLVYTILTTLAVGIFILLENFLNALAVGRGVGLGIELAVALSLGLSFNALHKRTEDTLERTLFRRKHQAARALQRLSEEAAYMESATALLERATTEIPQAVGASFSAVYERVDGGYRLAAGGDSLPKTIDTDDLAFVRLRKDLSQVDLNDVASALGSDGFAFAFAVRGQLFGTFVCGRRTNGESYAPDEIALLRNVSHEVGAELHAIRTRQHAELLDALVSGRLDLQSVKARLDEMGAID
ncbi:MAG TPA: hypothetical protein VGW96_06620 [Candidatus Eremiobacteraceae bacterium]|nr:hypothetical protein [Candidatus Eremiobacteraceae bacterium]